MSGLANMTNGRKQVHRQLLATASAVALLGFMAAGDARAAESGGPAIWLDLNGQFQQLADRQEFWIPDFVSSSHSGPVSGTQLGIQAPPQFGFDFGGRVSFRPADSNWTLSASVKLGKARRNGDVSKSEYNLPFFGRFAIPYASQYEGRSYNNESHMFIDFQAGKDVGLGMTGVASTVSGGIRIADLRSRKDVHISSGFPITYLGSATNKPESRISHEFRGVGPSIAWDASAAIAGARDDGQLGMDWGISAALLIGRQTVKQTIHGYYRRVERVHYSYPLIAHTAHSTRMRQRIAAVPNIGAYAAIAYRFPNAKLSFGYRADWFFNAQDGGLASTRLADRGFFGPFASISIGVSPSDF
jgi:hypothetical protein